MKGGIWICAAGIVLAQSVPAQSLIEPEHLAEVRQAFLSAGHASGLRCEIQPIRPVLHYNLQFQAGYVVDVPYRQPGGPGDRLNVLIRVTPEGKPPVYLGINGAVPDSPDAKVDAEIPGNFVVGEGSYSVEALVKDDAGRSCYSQWRIQAKSMGAEREMKPAVAAGAVRELGSVEPARNDTGHAIERLTVLVHAVAMNPRAAKLDDQTIRRLSDSLLTLLAQLPARSVRVVLFSLDKQAVLLDKANFTARDLESVTQAFEQVELAVVDYKTLQNRSKVDVLSDLVVKEMRDPKPASAVIVMGSRTVAQTDNTLQPDSARTGGPRGYYLQHVDFRTARSQVLGGGSPIQTGARIAPPQFPINPVPGPSQGVVVDGIDRLVRRFNGVTLPITAPHDLAEAIHRMAAEIPTVKDDGVAPAATPTRAPAARTETAELSDPTGEEDPVDVLAHLRDRVMEHVASVPNHTCVETVQRDRYEPLAGRSTKSCDNLLAARKRPGPHLRLDLTDWLRLDVGMADGREIFSWAGAAKFEEGEIDELIPEGAFGTGPFASMLFSVLENRNPHFIFDGETKLEGQRMLQYSFHVPRDESSYRVKAGKEWVVTGYSGTLMVNPRTSDLARFIVRTDELPPVTQTCEVDSTLDYNMVSLAGFEYLLPKSTRQRFIGLDGTEGENLVSFAACREFRGESTLTFGDRPAQGDEAGSDRARAGLAGGLALTIDLTTPFTPGSAAAGDRIQGKLVEALRDEHKVVAPAGTAVYGRLTRVELKHSGAGEYTVALRWEAIDINGERVPLSVKPNRKMDGVKAVARGVLLRRGMEIELPRTGEEHDALFHFPVQTGGVEGALRTPWVTTSAH